MFIRVENLRMQTHNLFVTIFELIKNGSIRALTTVTNSNCLSLTLLAKSVLQVSCSKSAINTISLIIEACSAGTNAFSVGLDLIVRTYDRNYLTGFGIRIVYISR